MNSITIHDMEEKYPKAAQLVEDTLQSRQISRVVLTETMMVFEALYHNVQEQLAGTGIPVTLTAKKRLGDLKITLGFEGGMMDPTDNTDSLSPETQILKTYSDKFDYSYRFGYNRIEIEVKKSIQLTQLIFLFAVLASVTMYAIFRTHMGESLQADLQRNIILPLEQLFANAMLMIAAPVTFFSLLKNRTNAYIVSEWNATVRRLYRVSLISSFIAVLMAILSALVVTNNIHFAHGLLTSGGNLTMDFSISETISSLLPSNIFEPFITISPFPLIILTLMVTYALFSAGKYFDLINQLIGAGYVVFSKMLSIIMFTMPFFLFIAFMDGFLRFGFGILVFLLQILITVFVSLLALMLFYFIRLAYARINPFHFMRQLIPLLKENYLINSSIDAAPYNIRWCFQNLKLNRKKLQESLPIMAQINLDGNCFLITLTTLIYISFSGTEVDLINLIGIGILVLFLSMGAPNQPGSCLIGMLIIFYHMNAFQLVPLAIFTEAMFGGLQNLVNVLGDIITVAVDNARLTDSKGRSADSKGRPGAGRN